MKTLYIIGNGFDLFHNLKTRYSDFYDFVLVKSKVECNQRCLLIYFLHKLFGEKLWHEFEDALGRPNEKELYKLAEIYSRIYPNTNDIITNVENVAGTILTELRYCFTEWIEHLKSNIATSQKIKLQKNHSSFLTFNYTDTLEQVYGIPSEQICYIHDEYDGTPKDEIGEVPHVHRYIFGCSKEQTVNLREGSIVRDFASSLVKDTDSCMQTNIWNRFISQVNDVTKIYILGHSVSPIDQPYFKKIKELIPLAKWFYAEREDVTEDMVKNNLKDIGIKATPILYKELA